MIEPLDGRTPPMTPQLALRVAIVGTVALAMFALIFFRLWFLQVLSGNQYVTAAKINITRSIAVAAPRGEILSSDGTVMVGSSPVPVVQIAPLSLPVPVTPTTLKAKPAADYVVYNALARVLKMSTKPSRCQYTVYTTKGAVLHEPNLAPIPCLIAQGVANQAYANVTIKTGVIPDIQAYLKERQSESQFQGVLTQQVYLRTYDEGDLGAQMFGTVGPITAQEVGTTGFKGAGDADIVGQTGLELEYDQNLLGVDGKERVKVNAADEFQGYGTTKKPIPGDNLKLSIDLALQKAGERGLAQSISTNKYQGADGGSFIAIDPENGQIYAMGSAPTYNPTWFTKPQSTAVYDKRFGADSGDPLFNRAIDTPLPDGSTFKVITATAALESGAWQLGQSYDDVDCYKPDPTAPCLHNSGKSSYGPTDLVSALKYSVDTFFYNLGGLMNADPLTHPNGGALQKWAAGFGIGQTTGVDLPGESSGALPTPNLFKALWKEERECDTATGPYAGHQKQPAKIIGQGLGQEIIAGGCGIANTPDWTIGDNVNTAVGQGNVQVTPLQLAVVYSALANNGRIVTPHIGEDIQSPTGEILQKIDPAPKRTLTLSPTYRSAILQGLHEAAQSPGGTSYDVMGNFGMPVYGKTGTAQEGTAAQIAANTESDNSWYACFVPATATTKPIVVVVSIEKGGFGDVAAAPVARQILSQWFYGHPGAYTSGKSTDT